ncbi:MAG: 2-oxoacid:acceptor oxidoreductase family protein [Bacillota bacterium]
MRKEVRIAGFGGQGVILAGIVVAHAAGVYEGKEVAQTQSYGPEARGGAARCDVVISDERILYPKVRKPHSLLCMSQPALDRYGSECDEQCLLVLDSTLVENWPRGGRVALVPATSIAEGELGNRMAANMVMLGALARAGGVVTLDSLRRAVGDVVSPRFRELNLRALEAGYERVRTEP